MEKKDNKSEEIKGAEALVIHNGNIVLGMQSSKRWYDLENGEKATVIKTLGGKIEKEDKNSSKRALIREILEEVKGIQLEDIRMTRNPIFIKKIRMGDLNAFDRENDLKMNADFYYLEIANKKNIEPNDLPALLEIPIREFLKLKFVTQESLKVIQKYVIKNKNYQQSLPEQYTLMIPGEIRLFLGNFKEYIEDENER